MDFLHRPTQPADLEACLPLLCDGFTFSAEEHGPLLELWRSLMREQMCETAVVEDRGRPFGERIVGFGMSVFLGDAVSEGLCASPTPFATKSLFRKWKQGRIPFLDRQQIRRANWAGGLNVMILHSGWPNAGSADGTFPAVRRTLLEALLEHHCGYSMDRFFLEVYGEQELHMMLAIGWRLQNDYQGHPTRDVPGSHPDHQPFLMSARREDVLKDAYHVLYHVFSRPPPRFFFRPSQQALLKLALSGKSDAGCAEEMEISIDTVRKRWRAVYERVHDVDPMLIGPSGEAKRGTEKRAALLRYLQGHPEELRPLLQKGQAARRRET